MPAIFNSDRNFPFKIALLIQPVKSRHISFANVRLLLELYQCLIYFDLSWGWLYRLPRGERDGNQIHPCLFFSFIWITLGWLDNVSKIVFRFWKISGFCGFDSGMFSVFVILIQCLLKIFATFCFSDIEHFFSIKKTFWS